ncbi:TIGR01777 family oxidoreductase [Xanthovirga aplysinae]|uniref:TIGR01777 family oxidoreductase n=1 Tax=Xanthovirga aplysinae TaxID=2529853 RepID=UPI0012BCE3A4|nr:TIGR01777 family oxidoreductase [Xanthovirga aplysinae]MTI29915.1 TIGR01777 family protein [Xanthovirga aplysinae]
MGASKNVLITGGTGLVGSALSQHLHAEGYTVSHLSRSSKKGGRIKTFQWDPERRFLEEGALNDIQYIIHLAGAGVADHRWTAARKKEILDSRLLSSKLLYEKLKELPHNVQAVVSASAIGYYGMDTGENLVDEETPVGQDFLAKVCELWEAEVDKIKNLDLRVVKFRLGLVLSKKGGAFPKLKKPVAWGVGAPLGSGKQFMSWIHIDDLCQLFNKALDDNQMQGEFNAVAPDPVTNREFTKVLAKVMGRPLIMPAVPSFPLRLVLGEMAEMLIGGNKVSCQKILDKGFRFRYQNLQEALVNLQKD